MAPLAPLVLSLLAGGCRRPPIPPGDPARPDIVLVSVDTLRADHVSCYGHDRPTTPFVDRLAASGVRFAHARSPAPWTLPSHTTMLSGLGPPHHRVVEDELRLADDIAVLPAILAEHGWATGGFVSTLYVSRVFGFDRGFDHFEDFGIHDEKRNLSGSVVAEDVVDAALDWLRDLPRARPFFLFLHFYDAHYAYDPPEPYASMFDRPPRKGDLHYRTYRWFRKHPPTEAQLEHQRAQYDEAIRYVDDQLARLDTELRVAGRAVRWVVTADHGEEFGERGSWGHAHTLYAEQLRVPLVVSGPGIPGGRVVEEVVGTEDIAPTLAAWAGAEPGELVADGQDLGPLLRGESGGTDRVPRYAETSRFETMRVGVLDGRWRLEWDLPSNRAELFDAAADPAERDDVAREHADEVRRLRVLAEEMAGRTWTARRAGEVRVEGGFVLRDGRRARRMRVAAGERFAVLPYDAPVRFVPADGGSPLGPWRAAGGPFPDGEAGDPLDVERPGLQQRVELSDAQREALEALGYLQGE